MTITEATIRATLNEILDPCSITAGVPAGLDDMGLLSDIRIQDDIEDNGGGRRVAVTVGVTEPTCVLIGSFANEAHTRLAALPGVSAVDVTLADDFDWTPDRLAPHYQRRLAEHRAQVRRALPLLAVTATGPARDR
ncbi:MULTISPECIES: metal-sulfur cluster assembly factor [unclassified Streptomyces]|uniref:metal-sulfur cluster assembly factor n=1 Tax=unclassified Streptomyces TaxID=2593676 RepID=UPI00225B1980|nr:MULTISPECIES: iron-sulfur cluster assembly protein [unclassified Streptomyces]MCX4409943.1 iron-sulfur cluster assembly protein [Streptomyces sp. NBC_01764]MCX5191713.1 iron-sulfur cluster assembly protein [Streptomyces sp. NBC_00268]